MGCALDESPKHVEFSPMNFVGLGGAEIWVSFMSTDEIRHMYLPVRLICFQLLIFVGGVTYNAGMHAPLVFFSAIR